MRGVYITYWPAGGGRGQNPCRTGLAQGLDLCLKYGPRALCSQFYMSQGRLYVPREVDLADKTRVAALPSSCPPGQPPLGHLASLGTYRIVTRVPLGRIFRIVSSSASSRPICLNTISYRMVTHPTIMNGNLGTDLSILPKPFQTDSYMYILDQHKIQIQIHKNC